MRLPSVLCIVDRPNWAHDQKTDALASALADSFGIVKRYQDQVVAADLRTADCVLLYYWLQVERLGHLCEVLRTVRDRVVIGICSHYELQDAWRRPGLATLGEFASAVFMNNRLLLEEFAPLLGGPVYYTPNGVDTTFFQPVTRDLWAVRQRTLRVGWAGSLKNQTGEHRGVSEFIAPAVATLDGAELRLAVREEKWRNRGEMLEYYHSIDVYVCASRSEGTPNPCLEAAACGLPVLTTRVGNMPEFIRDGENGFFVERDVGDITSKLRLLRDDCFLRDRLGRAARDTAVASWDWRHQARSYEEMLLRCLGTPNEAPDASDLQPRRRWRRSEAR